MTHHTTALNKFYGLTTEDTQESTLVFNHLRERPARKKIIQK